MIDIRGSLYTLFSALSIDCYHTRIDPFKADKFPALNVQYDRVIRQQRGHDMSFRTTATVMIVLAVATVAADFDSQLDTLVDNVLNKLLTDPAWNADFETVSNITTKYGYVNGGENDLATAVISLDVQFHEVFEPAITREFNVTHIDIDFIRPFDPNTGDTGPDGIIDGVVEFDPDAAIEEPLLEDYDTLPENK